MAGGDAPRDTDLDETNLKLSEGLKVCRSVIDNYRSMLSGESAPADDKEADRLEISGGPTHVGSD